VEIARQKKARMLVLETQSCNASAIEFYIKQGFDLIGFDLAAYSNEDVKRREVRLEFGLPL
jgi:ribosomal protein S18 acetylase RimI-like enzyme